MKILRTTPLLVVDDIEPILPLWRDRLGHEVLVEVPHEGRLGFVLLARDGHHLMLQTRASVAADLPAVAAAGLTHLLYCDVDHLDDVLAAMAGVEVLFPPRTTFYGTREAGYRVAPGHATVFAEPAKAS